MAMKITSPLSREAARSLKAGDSCLISGVIYTARDAAHKRLCELVAEGKELPLDVRTQLSISLALPPLRKVRPSALPAPPPPTVWMPIAPR